MKQKIRIIVVMLLSIMAYDMQAMCSVGCNISAHTTLVPRKMSQNLVLELALDNYYEYHRPECGDCPSWFSLEVTAPYYFRSTRAKKWPVTFCLTAAMYYYQVKIMPVI